MKHLVLALLAGALVPQTPQITLTNLELQF